MWPGKWQQMPGRWWRNSAKLMQRRPHASNGADQLGMPRTRANLGSLEPPGADPACRVVWQGCDQYDRPLCRLGSLYSGFGCHDGCPDNWPRLAFAEHFLQQHGTSGCFLAGDLTQWDLDLLRVAIPHAYGFHCPHAVGIIHLAANILTIRYLAAIVSRLK